MRRWVFVLAIGLLCLGVIVMVYPGLVSLGSPEAVLTAVGLIALLAGAIVANRGAKASRWETAPPNVEAVDPVPVTGDDVEEQLEYASPPQALARERRNIRKRTHQLVSDLLQTFEGVNEEAAGERISNGTWTEDPVAAEFLGAIVDEGSYRGSFRRQVFGPPPLRYRFEQTLNGIEEQLPGWEHKTVEPDRQRSFSLAAPRAGVQNVAGTRAQTNHWRGVSIIAFGAIGLGVVTEIAPLLLGGIVGITFAAYSRVGSTPSIDLEVERDLDPAEPRPGESVSVTVTIRNRGSRLSDVRLVDGVPRAVSVIEGNPRRSTALRTDESTCLSYTIEAVQGTHEWEPLLAISRSVNGAYEHRGEIDVDTKFSCKPVSRPLPDRVPLRTSGDISVGELPSQRAGEGVEFQSVREYRSGDRRARIGWRRYARFGELTTVEFREERATTVVIAIDARESAYLSPIPGDPHTVEIATEAADRLGISLLAAGHQVGLTSLAPDPCWVAPRADRAQRVRLRELLTTHTSVNHEPPMRNTGPYSWVEWLRSRLPGGAQVLFLSPLCDDIIVEIVIRLEARGHPVTIVSPDPSGGQSLGDKLVGMERAVRIAGLRRRGVTVIDWPPDQPLDANIKRLAGRCPS